RRVCLSEALGKVRHVVVMSARLIVPRERRVALVADLEPAAVAQDLGVNVVAVSRLAGGSDGGRRGRFETERGEEPGPYGRRAGTAPTADTLSISDPVTKRATSRS